LIEELDKAATDRDLERVRAVLAAGGNPNERNREGSTPLYCVAHWAEAIQLLIQAGADPNAASTAESQGLPLCFAAAWGLTEAVEALLEGGANPNLREDDGEGQSPLVWAAQNNHVETARVLLRAGADPNLDVYGRTALHVACVHGHLDFVRELLAAGAAPLAKDSGGQRPIDIAREWSDRSATGESRRADYAEIMSVLRSHGAATG